MPEGDKTSFTGPQRNALVPRAGKTGPTAPRPAARSPAVTTPAAAAQTQVNLKTPAIQPVSERFPALEQQDAGFTFFAPEAKSVQVAGTFNDWRPEANPLAPSGCGEWAAKLPLKSGQYEYRFVVDGVWTDDPRAAESATNPYGGINSVLKVGLDDRTDFL